MSDYRRMPLAQKLEYARASHRRVPLVRCPDCSAQMAERDLPGHQRSRCPGSRERRDEQLLADRAAREGRP